MDPKLKLKHKLKMYNNQTLEIKKNKKKIVFVNKTVHYNFSKN